ncbi:MAG: DUF2586 domain-containing protein [Prevotellaceae bacterium]|jgi:hypothetical protein|nr:DUF2586 domain-containing protein [Prevotellaceae bacterium]
MNGITFKRGNGGLARQIAGEDHISGLFYLTAISGMVGNYEFHTIEEAEAAGITTVTEPLLHYQISEFFRLAPGATLFVFVATSYASDYSNVKQLQQYTGGKLRRLGVLHNTLNVATMITTEAGALNTVCEQLADQNMPLTAIITGILSSANIASLPNVHTQNMSRVGVCLAQDGKGYGAYLQAQSAYTIKTITALGALLGTLAKRRVSDSIGWVEKYNVVTTAYPKTLTGGVQPSAELDAPALCDGTLISALTPAQLQTIHDKGYILLLKHVGYGGTYWNDAFAGTALTSDYAYLENTETMDKACRGVYQALLPQVSGPVYMDAQTGKIAESTCKSLEALAEVPLAQMERDGELSGYAVSIDPAQEVLQTSKLQVVIRLVPVGVLRELVVTIGFTLNTQA